jgi:hypothetical protein
MRLAGNVAVAGDERLCCTTRERVNGARRKLLARSAGAYEQGVGRRLGHESQPLAKVPCRRRLAQDAMGIGLPELAPRARRQVPTFGKKGHSTYAEKKQLAPQIQRVAGVENRSRAPNAVHPHFAATDALDGDAVVLRSEHELAARKAGSRQRRPRFERARALPSKASPRLSGLPFPSPEHLRLPRGRGHGNLTDALRLFRRPRHGKNDDLTGPVETPGDGIAGDRERRDAGHGEQTRV